MVLIYCTAFSQVGIGTATPNVSAQLEINSTNKGLLIPQINLSNINVIQLDGTNTAANGLMIYNTNATVTGGDGIGMYVFNGTIWEKLTVNAKNISVIPVFSVSPAVLNNTGSSSDWANTSCAIEPSLYNKQGNIEVKMVIRYSSVSGNVHLQLRAHDIGGEVYPIVNSDAWNYATTQTGGVVTSPWKSWNAGTNAYELHFNAWTDFGAAMTIDKIYLLVRSQ